MKQSDITNKIVKSLKESVEDTLTQLETALKSHDWYYEMSDSNDVYNRGKSQKEKIEILMDKASSEGKGDEAKALYDKYDWYKKKKVTENKPLSKDVLEKREKIIKGLKDKKSSLVKRYGKDAENVMYGRSTNIAKKQVKEGELNRIKEVIKNTLTKPKPSIKEDRSEAEEFDERMTKMENKLSDLSSNEYNLWEKETEGFWNELDVYNWKEAFKKDTMGCYTFEQKLKTITSLSSIPGAVNENEDEEPFLEKNNFKSTVLIKFPELKNKQVDWDNWYNEYAEYMKEFENIDSFLDSYTGIYSNPFIDENEDEDEVDYNDINSLKLELSRLISWSNKTNSKGADSQIEQLKKRIEDLSSKSHVDENSMFRDQSKPPQISNIVVIPNNLTTDPYDKRGEEGKIIAISKDNTAVVEFKDGTIGLYDNDIFIDNDWNLDENKLPKQEYTDFLPKIGDTEKRNGVEYTVTKVDPETGSITWKVKYNPKLKIKEGEGLDENKKPNLSFEEFKKLLYDEFGGLKDYENSLTSPTHIDWEEWYNEYKEWQEGVLDVEDMMSTYNPTGYEFEIPFVYDYPTQTKINNPIQSEADMLVKGENLDESKEEGYDEKEYKRLKRNASSDYVPKQFYTKSNRLNNPDSEKWLEDYKNKAKKKLDDYKTKYSSLTEKIIKKLKEGNNNNTLDFWQPTTDQTFTHPKYGELIFHYKTAEEGRNGKDYNQQYNFYNKDGKKFVFNEKEFWDLKDLKNKNSTLKEESDEKHDIKTANYFKKQDEKSKANIKNNWDFRHQDEKGILGNNKYDDRYPKKPKSLTEKIVSKLKNN